jgi:hypothetical protein
MKTTKDVINEAIDELETVSAIIGRVAFLSIHPAHCDEYLGILKKLHELKIMLQGMKEKE